MGRNGKWDVRIQNSKGSQLDEFVNVSSDKSKNHDIDVMFRMTPIYKKVEIQEALQRHQFLQECLILSLEWSRFLTALTIVFDSIWESEGKVRPNLEVVNRVVVAFELVEEFQLHGALTDAAVETPEEIGSGFSEVSIVKLVDDPARLGPFASRSNEFHHLALLFESERRVDIVFSGLAIGIL